MKVGITEAVRYLNCTVSYEILYEDLIRPLFKDQCSYLVDFMAEIKYSVVVPSVDYVQRNYSFRFPIFLTQRTYFFTILKNMHLPTW